MTPLPYLKFFKSINSHYGKDPEEVIPPTRTEWEMLRGYEPTKFLLPYENFAQNYVKYETESLKRRSECQYTINKISVMSGKDPEIVEIEKSKNFIGWIS